MNFSNKKLILSCLKAKQGKAIPTGSGRTLKAPGS